MFYLVIDLEMCRVPRDYRNKAYHYAYETIQIGAVLLNEEFKQVGTIREYVHPEHGVIDPFIEKLTGIKNSQVKKAPCIGEALVHMIDWIGDREYKVYAWSESDRNQLKSLTENHLIIDPSVLYHKSIDALICDLFCCDFMQQLISVGFGVLVWKKHWDEQTLIRKVSSMMGWMMQ